MDELEAMKAISDKLEKLADDERARVLSWAIAKYGDLAGAVTPVFHSPAGAAHAPSPPQSPKGAGKTPAKTKSKKTKSIIAMDKSLNLSPSGKKSASQFAQEKAPTSVIQKCVVAVYYLREHIGMEAVTVSGVYTFFKTLTWPIPADLRNTLQQAGTKGWLDTANSEDIKLTSMGENLIEHDLPPKPKA